MPMARSADLVRGSFIADVELLRERHFSIFPFNMRDESTGEGSAENFGGRQEKMR